MNPFALIAVLLVGWLLRRSAATHMESSSLENLPRGSDGIIEGAGTIERRAQGRRAVLILHGFGDTPQTVHYLADHLHGLGFTVRAPLLAGHGRTLRDFAESTADAWLDAAVTELVALRRDHDAIGLVGVSMGGALSVILAAASNSEQVRNGVAGAQMGTLSVPASVPRPDAMVLIAPYLSMRPRARRIAAMHWALAPFVRYLPSREEASIRDEVERKRNLGFGTVTPRLLHELQRLVSRARRALPGVVLPTMVIQSRDDNRIDPAAASQSFDRLGAREKRFEWTEGGGHVITVDVGRERVIALAGEWLATRVGGAAPTVSGRPPD